MAGPWFAVQRSGDGWQVLDKIWISNYGKNAVARVELRVELEPGTTEESSRHAPRAVADGADVHVVAKDAAEADGTRSVPAAFVR